MLCQLLVAGGEGYIHQEIKYTEKNTGTSPNIFLWKGLSVLKPATGKPYSEPLLYVPKM